MAIWILDPGHGGDDPGFIGTYGRKESDIVLEAVLEAKKHLERNGEKVVVTRNDNKNISFQERVKIANENLGKYYISFHMNHDKDNNEKGVQVVTIGMDEDENRLARLIRDEIFSGLRTEDKGVYQQLKEEHNNLNMSSIIVFGDYLSNEEIEKEFSGKKYGLLVAKACLAMVDKVLILQPKSEPKKLQKRAWRLCVGYYNNFDSATEAMKEMNKIGIKNAYVVPYDGK